MVRRPSRRHRRIADAFDALCDAIARALGAAQGAHDAAVLAHAEAMAEMWLRTDGLAAARADPALQGVLANPRLVRAVGRVEADRAAAFAPWLRTGPPRLAALVDDAAPGAAGDPVDHWLGDVGKADGSGPMPSLWAIGTGRVGGLPAAGFPVAVPLLDEAHLQITSTPDGRDRAEALVENLLLRVVSFLRPGLVQLHVWDVAQLTGTLPGLYPLTRSGLLTVHDPGRLPQLLEELADRIRRVHTRVLVDGHPSLRALAAAHPDQHRAEPWVVVALLGNRSALAEEDHRQLQRVARGGLACGVALVLLDVPMTINAPVETVRVSAGAATTSMTGPHVAVELDPPSPTRRVTDAGHTISAWYDDWRSQVGSFRDLLPARYGAESSVAALRAPVAFADGLPVEMVLGDASPHALIGGPSGSGKTNLLLVMISSMAARYGPDELELHLLDFKEGVSFAQFAPGRRDGTWLPHARLVGVNVNTDREFGLALLQFLADELRRRAEAAKAHEVTKLEELRGADPGGRWPRIVAVIDEFQYLFAERDAVTKAATALLEDVARRGRSQGIHLVLASQDTSGIEAFWGRPAVFEQFVLRIALPRARRVLADTNDASLGLPRGHAVLNHESGMRHGNEIVRVPNATVAGSVDEVQRTLHELYHEGRAEPRLFDGSRSPQLDVLVAGLPPGVEGVPRAVLGQCIDVEGRAAVAPLPAVPGRNVAVLATVGTDAVRVLGAAAGSLAGQFPAGAVDVLVVAPAPDTTAPAARLVERFAAAGHRAETVGLDGVRARVEALAGEVTARLGGAGSGRPTLVVLYAADAADTALGRSGTEALRTVLHSGPETGVHVLGWWRSVPRLRALLSTTAAIDDLGVWVALDVQGPDLLALAPGMLVTWSPRAGRGLFFDRARHARPEVVIVATLDEP